MPEHEPRTSFEESYAPVNRVRAAGARLAKRIRGEDPLARLAADPGGVQDQFLRRAERVLQDIEGQRARIVNLIEGQTARLVAQVVKRLNLATEAEVEQLGVRVAECERRLGEREIGPAPEEARREPIDGHPELPLTRPEA